VDFDFSIDIAVKEKKAHQSANLRADYTEEKLKSMEKE
jgi:hypothetical protein